MQQIFQVKLTFDVYMFVISFVCTLERGCETPLNSNP